MRQTFAFHAFTCARPLPLGGCWLGRNAAYGHLQPWVSLFHRVHGGDYEGGSSAPMLSSILLLAPNGIQRHLLGRSLQANQTCKALIALMIGY